MVNGDCNCGNGFQELHDCRQNGSHRGPSSFYKHNSNLVLEKLALQSGDTFLDLGCGAGDYSIYAAKIVGESGNVYALDLYQEILDHVCKEAQAQGIRNVHPVVSDIRQRIDIPDDRIDTCLIATVLHTIHFSTGKADLFSEVRRVLKPEGKLAVIECKKKNARHGPPMRIRISPEELEKGLGEYGFSKTDYTDLGPNYMMMFVLSH
jgi:ubiquinone/menaquinone biosynthesis C-methylase UbiE